MIAGTQMKLWFNISVFALIFILAPVDFVYPGAWTQKKNHFFFKLSGSYFHTTREFNHTGKSAPIFAERSGFENASFQDLGLNVYFEYGISHRITLVSTLPVKFLTSSWDKFIEFADENGNPAREIIPESPSTSGFSDLSIAGRYLLHDGFAILSFQGGIKLPLFYTSRPNNSGSPLGSGDIDLDALFLLGKSFQSQPLYLTGGIGYRYRGGALHDELLFTAEVGYKIKQFLFKVNLDGIRNTTTPPDLAGITVVTPLPGGGGVVPSVIVGDQHLTKISPAIILDISPKLAVQAEILHVFDGKNTVNGSIYSLGIILTN